MAMPAKDLTGQRFGFLTVIRRAGSTDRGSGSKCATWLCRCDCGNEVVRVSQYLRSKHRTKPKHCGCKYGTTETTHGNATHKMARSRPFQIWTNMRRRCADQRDKDWRNYGARGVQVCERWSESFENFWVDMGPTYQPGLTLDRTDNDGPYSPENCRWATTKEQSNNTRVNTMVETPLGEMTMTQAAETWGLKVVTVYARVNRYGWTLEQALTTPPGKKPSTSLTADLGTGSSFKIKKANP